MTTDPTIRAIGRALPGHRYASETLSGALSDEWGGSEHERARFARIHRATGVRARHLALPLEEYRGLRSFAASNEAWTRCATALGERAVEAALARAGLVADDVDHIFFNTVTGVASPSIDVKLINRLGMRCDVKRTPMFGLGCVGGAAGLARAADYLRAFPDDVAVLLSVELCSLTLQLHDRSIANVIATALFGDGAAAVVLAGARRARTPAGPRIIASRSLFFRDTEELMGWNVGDTGFEVVLTAGIPDLIRTHLRAAADAFLAAHGLERAQVQHWIAHTGGPKVLRAIEDALELPAAALARSWRSLEDVGNLSSASVLFVAADLLDARVAAPGDYGVLLSLGPGFCGELVLVQW
ncbi:MAG TPA: 3-oxoacyl-[acyl-carrier-protein] synthase III C-terminal domain-containing protein [Candidatus Binatia bacterium]